MIGYHMESKSYQIKEKEIKHLSKINLKIKNRSPTHSENARYNFIG
jgi:hypothetical protein